jgi:Protein of unknown function (DUF2630)
VDDEEILRSIQRMVDDEHALRREQSEAGKDGDTVRKRLADLEVALDQCWDLLRQRQARAEFGQDPDQAQVRPADVVERYWS